MNVSTEFNNFAPASGGVPEESMKQEFLHFYKKLYPWLTDEWVSTGADPASNKVWWRLDLETVETSGLRFTVQAGFKKTPSDGHLFLEMRSEYPAICVTEVIPADVRTTDFETVKSLAIEIATSLTNDRQDIIQGAIADRDRAEDLWKDLD